MYIMNPDISNDDYISLEQLVNVAKHKQQFEMLKWRKEKDPLEHIVPNLLDEQNYNILNDAANIILGSRDLGDSIEILANKLIVFCTFIKRVGVDLYLDNASIMRAINQGFNTYKNPEEFGEAIAFSLNILNGLNEAAKRRAIYANNKPTKPKSVEKANGGYYKKNYKRSIKKKSRKLRSRR